ncbi:MAG: hypothetical protein PHP31_07580 [Lentimicrobiaceae bacterium]|nr:hypothetical protein [Lentimicrobiaceae bacterium]
MKLKKYKYYKPYNKSGKTTFKDTQNKKGVYLIKENNKVVYIGHSTYNLYKTMYRHFQKWSHKQQQVISYNDRMNSKNYTVRIVLTNTAKQAQALERALIIKYRPRDNEIKYSSFLQPAEKLIVENYEKELVILECPF